MSAGKTLSLRALTCFFVFNPSLGDEHDESERVLYFYPPETEACVQQSYVGLVSGVANFCKDFSHLAAHSVHSASHRVCFLEAESGVWFVLVIRNARRGVASHKCYADSLREFASDVFFGSDEWTDVVECDTHDSEELDDGVLRRVVRNCYDCMVLMNGPLLEHVQVDGDYSLLRQVLAECMTPYLRCALRLDEVRYYADIYGFRFFAVDRSTYLSVQLLQTKAADNCQLSDMCALYSGRLIWSGLSQCDMKVLYLNWQDSRWKASLCAILAKRQRPLLAEASGTPLPAACSLPSTQLLNGEFVTGPMAKECATVSAPKVYIADAKEFRRLIVYKLRKLTLIWFKADDQNSETGTVERGAFRKSATAQKRELRALRSAQMEWFQKLQRCVEPMAEEICKELELHESKQQRRERESEAVGRYLYFNEQNSALKSVLRAPGKKLSSDTCKSMRDVHADFHRCDLTEVCAKSSADHCWLSASRSPLVAREVYVLLDDSDADSLAEVDKGTRHICTQLFSNIFMQHT